ncbi:MAG: hypothetical protein ACRCXC_01735 [Legionella sp.]
MPNWIQYSFADGDHAGKEVTAVREKLQQVFIEYILKPYSKKYITHSSKFFANSAPQLWVDEALVTDGITLLLAGHETTARLLTFAMILLVSVQE